MTVGAPVDMDKRLMLDYLEYLLIDRMRKAQERVDLSTSLETDNPVYALTAARFFERFSVEDGLTWEVNKRCRLE
jgi:hypothetical protein